MIQNLLSPIKYLLIKHDKKFIIDWVYPLIATILSIALMYALNYWMLIDALYVSSILIMINGVIVNLPECYLLVLVILATSNRPHIDTIMCSPAPKMKLIIRGVPVVIELTRRRFLCSMFSFLTTESILLIAWGMLCKLNWLCQVGLNCHPVTLCTFLFLFMLWQLVMISLWGLFYLGYRLHQPNS